MVNSIGLLVYITISHSPTVEDLKSHGPTVQQFHGVVDSVRPIGQCGGYVKCRMTGQCGWI